MHYIIHAVNWMCVCILDLYSEWRKNPLRSFDSAFSLRLFGFRILDEYMCVCVSRSFSHRFLLRYAVFASIPSWGHSFDFCLYFSTSLTISVCARAHLFFHLFISISSVVCACIDSLFKCLWTLVEQSCNAHFVCL